MKELSINILKLIVVWAIVVLFVATYGRSAYAKGVHPHGELALVGYTVIGAYSPLRAFFMRTTSMRSHVMAKLEGDTSECAGLLLHLSTNPFQLCHPHLVVNGKAPNLVIGAH